ncbi:endopeptidase La [Mycoplasma sp. AC1221]
MKNKNIYPLLVVDTNWMSFPKGIHQIETDAFNLYSSGALVIPKTNIEHKFVISFTNNEHELESKAVFVKFLKAEPLEPPVKDSERDQKCMLTYEVLGFFNIKEYGFAETDEDGYVLLETYQPVKEGDGDKLYEEQLVRVCSGEVKFVPEEPNSDETNEVYKFDLLPQNHDLDAMLSALKGIRDTEKIPGIKETQSVNIIFQYNPITKKPYTTDDLSALINSYYPNFELKTREEKIKFLFTFLSFLSPEINEKFAAFYKFNIISLMKLIASATGMMSQNVDIESQMTQKMTDKMASQHKEYVLREKLKYIQDELEGMNVDPSDDDDYAKELKDKNKSFRYPESVKKIIAEETKRANEMMATSPEANISKTYVNHLKKLPWRLTQKELLDLDHAKKTLSKYHYGLEEVKQRVLEYIAVIINTERNKKKKENKLPYDENYEIDMNLFKDSNKQNDKTFNNVPIICLVGPPGTGKTSLSKAIAESLSRKFVKISLGGVHDESEIRGHRRTYVGAMPGKIIKAISQCSVSNPVILLDEIDKMASTNKGDPASAMLEVLDPEQNTKFQDHYLEHEYDLSKAIFIATANYYENIPHALIDRVEVIELSAYTLTEKLKIAQQHLMPKVTEQVGASSDFMHISEDTMKYIIQNYTKEAGVRGLKRVLDKLARKFVLKKLELPKLKNKQFEVKINDLKELLGPEKFKDNENDGYKTPGVVNGLAYTSVGGSTLQIEVNTYPGKGEIKLTGSLKDVMKESANISLSYVRANAARYGITDFNFDETTIHIHVPEGAVPKDGPSAGVTFTTALISALSQRIVSSEIGMTGEITLRGNVLDIGGLKEKSFAAASKNLKYVFIPTGNVKNLIDVPMEIKEKLTYIPVSNYEEIYEVVFEKKKPKKQLEFKQ